jgi:transposase
MELLSSKRILVQIVRVYPLKEWKETKAHARRRIRSYLRRGIRFTIPRLSNELRRGLFSPEIYRQRNNIVECAINRLKNWRRIATRYEKLRANYTAMIRMPAFCCG